MWISSVMCCDHVCDCTTMLTDVPKKSSFLLILCGNLLLGEKSKMKEHNIVKYYEHFSFQ